MVVRAGLDKAERSEAAEPGGAYRPATHPKAPPDAASLREPVSPRRARTRFLWGEAKAALSAEVSAKKSKGGKAAETGAERGEW